MSSAVAVKLDPAFEPWFPSSFRGDEGRSDGFVWFLDDNAPTRPAQEVPRTLLPQEWREAPVLMEVLVFQAHSGADSLDHFVARQYRHIPGVLAVYRQRAGDTLCFYIVLDEGREEALEAVFDQEKFFYDRFAEENLDFQVLPSAELECCTPSGAVRLWRR